ncbi:Serine/threonine protein kinase [Granulicella rosea]|uniref:non-specific serine/threonine protein kinase n=1 Tax=Granulicella rosea TaxID=474952 RepID=A0A239H9A9_9BACT|nr:protein kinase [Granulicella rosea]SNS77947.1 Serine/threonine protein kinase [Granulicella rosea]
MIPEPGQRFGPYEILGRLGGGGMGLVFRAWDARLHREVAIKLLHDEFSMSGMRERFLREARAASALNHPNICTIFDIGDRDGDPYLVMELLEGETLKDRIMHKIIPVDEIVCYAREVAEALAAAHAKGIVHRDVKPANIFLVNKPNGKSQAKVLDFGLAKIESNARSGRGGRSLDLTTAGATVGTLAYMSPEQARGEVLDSRSDLFSLGVVMYEMATRQVPFKGTTSALVFVKLLNHPPEPVRDWNDSVPRELEKIIFKLLAKERTQRYQTATELEEALRKFSEKGTGGGWLRRATIPLVKAPDPIARERRQRQRLSEAPTENFDEKIYPDSPPRIPSRPEPPAARPRSGEEAFLRPVARVPRGSGSPAPLNQSGALPAIPGIPTGPVSPAAFQAQSAPPETAAAVESGEISGQATSWEQEPPALVPTDLDPTGRWPAAARESDSETTRTHYDDSGYLEPRRVKRTPPWVWAVAGIVGAGALVTGIVFAVHGGRFRPMMLTEKDTLILTSIENRTGDKALDGSVSEGLQMALRQSPYLALLTRDDYRSTLQQLGGDGSGLPGEVNPVMAHKVAERLGAKAYIYGTITGSGAPYTIHVEMQDTVSNETMATVEEHVPSQEQIATTIDRISDTLRSDAGEDSDSIARTHVPLSREATASMEALHAYTLGEAAARMGQPVEALAAYKQAATLDPKFVRANLRLTLIYRQQRAEVAAAEAARAALDGANAASERTRLIAQYTYEMNASGDYLRATAIIRQMLTTYPHDAEVLSDLARALRLQGHLSEALQAAQQAYAADPLSGDAYTQAEIALIGLDRYDAALQLDMQVQRLGGPRDGVSLIAAYLAGRQDLIDAAVAESQTKTKHFTLAWNHGLYLDNSGRIEAGTAFWRDRAATALEVPGLASSSSTLLSQGALNRALIGSCGEALSMAREAGAQPRGPIATFNIGMASALCGDTSTANAAIDALASGYPQSTSVNGYYIPDLKAALALGANDPEAALEALKSARQYDLISLTPYLRGRAHVALRQVQIGIVDFQTLLSHRGITFTVGSDVYPMAEIGVARAFADTGDHGNSASAYKSFLELWKNADPGQPLLSEAESRTR